MEITDHAAAAEPDSAFEQHLEIETPERVPIRFDLAGVGSRFAAGTIDGILVLGAVAIVLVVLVFALRVTERDLQESAQWVLFGISGVVIVLVWAYFLGFELAWSGRTPGKRVLGLRVMSEDGGPASPASIVVRNVLRVADMLPVPLLVHVLGGVVMFVSPRSKRLGDLAAGTVVVLEREVELSLDHLSRGAAESLDAGRLSGSDRALVLRWCERRAEFVASARAAAAAQVVARLRERHELPDWEPEVVLLALARGADPANLVAQAGPRPGPEPAGA